MSEKEDLQEKTGNNKTVPIQKIQSSKEGKSVPTPILLKPTNPQSKPPKKQRQQPSSPRTPTHQSTRYREQQGNRSHSPNRKNNNKNNNAKHIHEHDKYHKQQQQQQGSRSRRNEDSSNSKSGRKSKDGHITSRKNKRESKENVDQPDEIKYLVNVIANQNDLFRRIMESKQLYKIVSNPDLARSVETHYDFMFDTLKRILLKDQT
eukprot:Pgem_evm1s9478